jgi:hypothetical protein
MGMFTRKPSGRRLRKYVVVAVAFAVAAGLGVASAQWVSVPNGHGNAYGHGRQPLSGSALSSITLSAGQLADVGPNETGTMTIGVSNNNPFSVTVTRLVTDVGAVITSVDDPTCVAPAATFSMAPWTGSAVLTAGQQERDIQVPIVTEGSFPSCLAGATFSVPVVISATG